MFNIFLFLTEDVGIIDLPNLLEECNEYIFYILIIALGIGVIRYIVDIAKEKSFETVVNFVMFLGVSSLAIYLVMNPNKLMLIGDAFHKTIIGLLNSIFKIKKNIPKNTGTELLIGFNLFAKMNPDPKNIEEADSNRKQLQKNVVKKQNKDQKKIVKKGWL